MRLDPVRVRLLSLIERKPTDLKNASLAIGRNPAYLHQFVHRGSPRVLSERTRQALARHLGGNEDELRHDEEITARQRPAASTTGRRLSRSGERKFQGHVPVTEIDVRASAGPGAFHEGLESAKGVWLFPEEMIYHEFRARADDLHIITIDGDSMEPLLSTGDRILIDTSQRVPVPPGIFVIWDGMGIVAKRIENVLDSEPAKILIKSMNPEYQTYERHPEEINIVGRVVWMARRL